MNALRSRSFPPVHCPDCAGQGSYVNDSLVMVTTAVAVSLRYGGMRQRRIKLPAPAFEWWETSTRCTTCPRSRGALTGAP